MARIQCHVTDLIWLPDKVHTLELFIKRPPNLVSICGVWLDVIKLHE